MNVFTSSELATKTKMVCDATREQGCAFITTNGKTDLMIIDIREYPTINDAVHSYDSWHARNALERIWKHTDNIPMTEEKIEEIIGSVRNKRP